MNCILRLTKRKLYLALTFVYWSGFVNRPLMLVHCILVDNSRECFAILFVPRLWKFLHSLGPAKLLLVLYGWCSKRSVNPFLPGCRKLLWPFSLRSLGETQRSGGWSTAHGFRKICGTPPGLWLPCVLNGRRGLRAFPWWTGRSSRLALHSWRKAVSNYGLFWSPVLYFNWIMPIFTFLHGIIWFSYGSVVRLG